jgi:predicted permease
MVMRSFLQDLRHGIRLVRQKPAVAFVVAASIAIGVSATTTVYCWIESVVVNPLPVVPASDELQAFATRLQSGENITTSYADYRDYLEQSQTLAGITAFQQRPLSLESGGHTQRVWAMMVTGNFFDVLAIRSALGHFFLPEEHVDATGGQPVAVISYAFWQTAFGGLPSIVGRTIRLNRQNFTIIGVAPAGFTGTVVGLSFDIWVPLLQQDTLTGGNRAWVTNRRFRSLQAIARLKPGVTRDAAQSEMDLIASRLAGTYGEENAGTRAVLFPLEQDPFGAQALVGPLLNVLLAVSFVVLLIVCANVTNLLLAQAGQREREIGVRLALGAGKGRVFRQLMTEGLVLAVPAAVLSVLLTVRLVWVLDFLLPRVDLPILFSPAVSTKVLIFAVVLSTGAAMLTGLTPAVRSVGLHVVAALKEGQRGTSGGRGKLRLRTTLAVSEVALALVALIGAGLLVKSFRNVTKIDPGFDYEHVSLASLTPSSPGHTRSDMQTFYRTVKDRVRALPPVRGVSYAEWVPLGLKGGSWEELSIDGYTKRAEENMRIYRNLVDDDYFDVMRIPLVAGRVFDERDTDAAPAVAIVNEAFVRRFIGGGTAVGHTIRGWGKPLTIVGVVKDTKYATSTELPQPYFYVPFRQFAGPETEVVLHVAVNGAPENLGSAVRREVETLNSVAYVSSEMPLKQYIAGAAFRHRIAATCLSVLGAAALLLAALGIYGVMSYSVAQRTNEIGIRMALGASNTNILSTVVFQGVRMAAIGWGIGIAASMVVARFLTVLLYGVDPIDPLTLIAVSGLILVVAFLASAIPALRAGRLDPMNALRMN